MEVIFLVLVAVFAVVLVTVTAPDDKVPGEDFFDLWRDG